MTDNYVAIRIKATDTAKPDLTELRAKLDELRGEVAEARVNVSDAEADAKLTDLEAKLEAVGKKIANPKIDVAGAARANAQLTEVDASMERTKAEAKGLGAGMQLALLGIGVGAAVAVKQAGDFQDQTVHLVTDAGEAAKNLGMVQQGILQVSDATGTAAASITDGMYHIESGGLHAQSGLAVLKVAAEGAKVGGADLDVVSKTLVGTLNAYSMTSNNSAKQTQFATSMMNQLIATVGAGDMRMNDLAASLGNVAPVAAAAKISFSEIGGAIATMTAQNMSAQQATQDLRHTIVALSGPNATTLKEWKALGLNAHDLQANLGKRGLSGTLELITAAAKAHSAALGQTYVQAINKATGGITGMNTTLMITGDRMATFKANIATIAAEAKKGGTSVDNWSKIQSTFNFKLDSAKTSLINMGITLGSVLLPAVTAIITPLTHMLTMIAGNKVAAALFAAVIGGVVAGALGKAAAGALKDFRGGLEATINVAKGIPGVISSVGSMASSVASGISTAAGAIGSAASAVGKFSLQMVQGLARAAAATATWLVEQTVAAATAIGEFLAEAAAATVAFVAENLATLGIVALIALLIAAIVYLATHWKQVWADVKKWALDAWHFLDNEVIHPIADAIAAVVDWIKSHWQLLLAILTGPIGIAVLLITHYWSDITHGVSVAIDWVKQHWPLLLAILTGPIGLATLWIVDHWSQITNGASRMFSNVVNFFTQLPGKILSAVGDLSKLLWNAGVSVINGLIGGLENAVPGLHSALSWVSSMIPSWKGPPSKDKTLLYDNGQLIMQGLVGGIHAGLPRLQSTLSDVSSRISGGVQGRASGYGAGGGGTMRAQLEFVAGSDDLLIRWLRNAIRVRGGNVQLVLGQGGG